jgi:dCMP deaminase
MPGKRENYLSWDDYFMGIADLSAQRSKDPKTQVGCCIINPETKRILSIGYNGLPRGFDDDTFDWSETKREKHSFVIHAEVNAILNTDADLDNSSVYVTMFPCSECAKLLVQAGISEIIYRDEKFRTKETGEAANEIFKTAGVQVRRWLDAD